MNITSPAFFPSSPIPAKYTCDGDNINPPLKISGIPNGAKGLVLIVDDPDSPGGTWQHWLIWNLPPRDLAENSAPGIQGNNDFGDNEYGGPCPHGGLHHYHFRVYAIDIKLDLPTGSSRKQLDIVLAGHVLGTGELIGTYTR